MSEDEGRITAEARFAAARVSASIRPLHLPQLEVDPIHLQSSSPVDPFWRTRRSAHPAASLSAAEPQDLWAAVEAAELQVFDWEGEGEGGRAARVSRRVWFRQRGDWPEIVVQSLVARPRLATAGDAHDDLRDEDDETRGWALCALAAAGLDFARWRAEIVVSPLDDVPAEERDAIEPAPNMRPEPNPVFAALDQVERAQADLHLADVRRVTAAVRAWRVALHAEGAPGASGTAYQKGFFVDLGAKLKVADVTARSLVHAADDLERDLPTVWRTFLDGALPWRAMQIAHAAIDGMERAVLPEFDMKAERLITRTPVPRLADALRRLRERLQAETADERHDRAAGRRRVEIEPGADGMGWLHAYLPMVDVIAIDHQLSKGAVAAHGVEGETRTVPQLRADSFRDVLISRLRDDADGSDPDALVPTRCGVEPKVAVLIPVLTALGRATSPAILEGYGPIGIRTALRLAGAATSWIKVLTDPVTGAIQNLAREKYRPTADMRALLALLDGGSRGPGSFRRASDCEVDHNRSFRLHDEQGETAIDNLVLLSHPDHGRKTDGEADAVLLPDRTLVWRSAGGQTYVTRPLDPPEPLELPTELMDDPPF